MTLATLPIPVKRAHKWCALVHRKLKAIQGSMWSVAVLRDGVIVGIAIVGRPQARLLDSRELPQPMLEPKMGGKKIRWWAPWSVSAPTRAISVSEADG